MIPATVSQGVGDPSPGTGHTGYRQPHSLQFPEVVFQADHRLPSDLDQWRPIRFENLPLRLSAWTEKQKPCRLTEPGRFLGIRKTRGMERVPEPADPWKFNP
jgi:hypothetical protein